MITIRAYDPSDRAACLALFTSNVPDFFGADEQPGFERFLDAPDAEFAVATRANRVIGCGGSYVRDGVGRLCWGMVQRELQGQSVGTALLWTRIEALFSQASVSRVALSTSQRSAAFFARFGFTVTETIADGLAPGVEEVRMQLRRDDWERS